MALYFILSKYHDHDLLSYPMPKQNANHTKIKTRISRLGELYFFQGIYFPILSSKGDISFRLELVSAHVKFDRLNQQSNLSST